METSSQEVEQNIHEFFKNLIVERDNTIARLESELETLKKAPPQVVADPVLEQKLLATNQELQSLRKENATLAATYQSQVNNLNESVQRTREDYQNLRRQKGGFGFIALLACLGAGALFGFGLHWLFFTPKQPQAVVFQKFRDENQFNIEYDISQGRFDNIEATLKSKSEKKEYAAIQAELEFFRKIMGATKRKLADSKVPLAGADGYSLAPEEEEINVQEKAKKSLTATEPEVSIRAEASTTSEKLGKMKKGETAGVWDRTFSLDKLTTTVEGNKYEVQDYWYKIETKDGVEGWVFGFFTNRSLNRKVLVGEPSPDPIILPQQSGSELPKPAEKPAPPKPDGGN